MIIAHPSLEHTVCIEDGSINVLVIEHPGMLCRYVEELKLQSHGQSGRFSLYDGVKCVSLNNIVKVIVDPFALDLNSKEILSPIYSKLSAMSNDENHYDNFADLSGRIVNFISDLTLDLGISMDCDGCSGNELIKMTSPKLLPLGDTLLERIVEYLDLSSEFSKVELYVFVNLNTYLTKTELNDLYQHITYHKINTLFLESKYEDIICNEHLIIVDYDLCELYF